MPRRKQTMPRFQVALRTNQARPPRFYIAAPPMHGQGIGSFIKDSGIVSGGLKAGGWKGISSGNPYGMAAGVGALGAGYLASSFGWGRPKRRKRKTCATTKKKLKVRKR